MKKPQKRTIYNSLINIFKEKKDW